jgi:hypothetical protein
MMIVIGVDDCLFFDARCVDIYVERVRSNNYIRHISGTCNRNLQNNNESLSLSDGAAAAAAAGKEYNTISLSHLEHSLGTSISHKCREAFTPRFESF